ncbi:T9SS type A sorting domain-containing protein [Bacteroidota bacterium]
MKNTRYKQVITSMALICFLGAITPVIAQDDNSDTKVKVKIVTEKNGKKEVIEKTYNSIEDFEADKDVQTEHLSDLEGLHVIDIANEEKGHIVVKMDKQVNSREKAYTIKIEDKGDGEMVFIDEEGTTFKLKSPPDSDSLVWVDEDGKTKTIHKKGNKTFAVKEGEKVYKYKYEFDTDDDKEHEMVFITTGNDKTDIQITDDENKMIIVRADEEADVDIEEYKDVKVIVEENSNSENEINMTVNIEEDNDSTVKKRVKKVIVKKDANGNYNTSIEDMDEVDKEKEMNVWVGKLDEDGKKKTITVKVIKEENVEVSVSEAINGDTDLEGFDLGDYKPLKLKSFNCDPNPNKGQFTLSFSTADKPLSIRIYNQSGKKVFFEKIDDFAGNYSKDIDLGGKAKGAYVLQISQDGKAVNKKLLIQ